MKKSTILLLTLMVIVLSSFKLGDNYPCHPNGDLGPCTHPMHPRGDLGACTHTFYDAWGNLCYQHSGGDVYPCTHPLHYIGDVYPCVHFCY